MVEDSFLCRRGKRLGANRVKVRLTRNGQFSCTIPRVIAVSAGLRHGDILVFSLNKLGGVRLDWERVEDGEG